MMHHFIHIWQSQSLHWQLLLRTGLILNCYFIVIVEIPISEEDDGGWVGGGGEEYHNAPLPPLDFICLTTFNHLHFAAAEHSLQLFSTECC